MTDLVAEGMSGVGKGRARLTVICKSFAANHCNIFFGAEPILNSFALRTGVTTTQLTKFEPQDYLSPLYAPSQHPLESKKEQSETLTNRKTLTIPSIVIPTILSLHLRSTLHDLHTNINSRLLSKHDNLRPCTQIPAHERFISACAHEVLGGQSDGADTVEVACELLEGGECDGGKEVDAAVWCGVA
jgi:hypothetical protein